MLEKAIPSHVGGNDTGEETTVEAPPVAVAPFVVEHRRTDGRGGDFVPGARLVLAPALRTAGLWAALPAEELRDLLLLLTFLTPNGWLRPALPELADAMSVSPGAARDRLRRLTARRWRGGPVAVELPRGGGLDAYAPGRHLLSHEREAAPEEGGQAPLTRTAGREAVIGYSRARYARTRQEVEAEISERMDWGPPAFIGEDPQTVERKRAAFAAMMDLGMAKAQALDLLSRHELERVERQVAWIGRRGAKSPARLLAAAIEHDYEAPPVGRLQQAPPGGPRPALHSELGTGGPPAGEASALPTNEREGP